MKLKSVTAGKPLQNKTLPYSVLFYLYLKSLSLFTVFYCISLHHGARYLSDLLPQHGGAGVDHKHHVLRHGRQVFGRKVVDEVTV